MGSLLPRIHGVVALVSVVFFTAAGCGGPRADVVEVSGVVTRNGKPVPNLFLNFMPTQGRPSWGFTDAEGRFELEYGRNQKGALRGRHKVWVVVDKPRTVEQEMAMRNRSATESADTKAIREKYGQQATSTLEFDIQQDGQELEIKLD